jgi:hypothetical protein
VAKEFAAQLTAGKAAFVLPVTLTPASTVTLQRLLEVNLSEQMLYLKENGGVVDSWPISSGVASLRRTRAISASTATSARRR